MNKTFTHTRAFLILFKSYAQYLKKKLIYAQIHTFLLITLRILETSITRGRYFITLFYNQNETLSL